MKVQIRITGQIGGNYKLRSSLPDATESGQYNSFILDYNSIREAKQAIKKAYKSLIMDEPENKGMSGIRKSKDNTSLFYDASKAVIT